jgi:hypothetical protein
VHASIHHGFDNGFRPFLDISRVIDHCGSELDWEQVSSRGTEWGARRAAALALSLATKLVGVPVPDEVVNGLQANDEPLSELLRAEELVFAEESPVAPNIARLFDGGTVLQKVVHFMKCAFPSGHTMEPVNPDSGILQRYGLYFFRIKGLLRRHGVAAVPRW